jgi:adenylate kinase
MGIPGSGKGTQGRLLAEALGYTIISTGQLLRAHGTADQHARMQAGEILGDKEVTDLLDKSLAGLSDQNKVILDGYPRRVNQARWLIEESANGRFEIERVVLLVAAPEAVIARLKARGRKDDNDASIKARFKEYETETLPIVEFLRSQGVEIVEANAEKSVTEVHQGLLNLGVKEEI